MYLPNQLDLPEMVSQKKGGVTLQSNFEQLTNPFHLLKKECNNNQNL